MKLFNKRSRKLHKPGLKDEKGQAMVEFALILPILVILVCGIFDVSWFMFGKLSLENAAREAARAGSVGTTVSEATTDANLKITALVPDNFTASLTKTVSFTNSSQFRDGDIIVNVGTDIEPLTPITGIFTDTIHIEAQCEMKMN